MVSRRQVDAVLYPRTCICLGSFYLCVSFNCQALPQRWCLNPQILRIVSTVLSETSTSRPMAYHIRPRLSSSLEDRTGTQVLTTPSSSSTRHFSTGAPPVPHFQFQSPSFASDRAIETQDLSPYPARLLTPQRQSERDAATR